MDKLNFYNELYNENGASIDKKLKAFLKEKKKQSRLNK